jgi:hypothetical protein
VLGEAWGKLALMNFGNWSFGSVDSITWMWEAYVMERTEFRTAYHEPMSGIFYWGWANKKLLLWWKGKKGRLDQVVSQYISHFWLARRDIGEVGQVKHHVVA